MADRAINSSVTDDCWRICHVQVRESFLRRKDKLRERRTFPVQETSLVG